MRRTLRPGHSIMINRCRIVYRFKLRQNAPLGDLFIFYFSQQFKLSKHRFKLRQNAPLSYLVFKNIFRSSNFQNIASNSVRMHRLASLISIFSQQFQLFLKKKFRWGGGGDSQPPTIFLFRVNFILPTIRLWSHTLQGCSKDG